MYGTRLRTKVNRYWNLGAGSNNYLMSELGGLCEVWIYWNVQSNFRAGV